MARRPVIQARVAPGSVSLHVAYYRVSTDKQGRSGLGLEAQVDAVARHVASVGGRIVAEFREVESGKRDDRPELRAALAACRVKRATLTIAKLDRLSRNLAFLANLMESRVEFVACDNPHATRFTIHILAAVAEHEREQISARTKAALAAAKARGTVLGSPRLRGGNRGAALEAAAARVLIADEYAADVWPFIDAARRAGASSLGELAKALMARGVLTPAGLTAWTASQVRRIVARVQPGGQRNGDEAAPLAAPVCGVRG